MSSTQPEEPAPGTVLTFVIPVCHPDNARNWTQLLHYLSHTMRSIAAQSSPQWNAIVVANHQAELPPMLPPFTVKRVDFPPNPHFQNSGVDEQTWREAFRLDKGQRVLAALLEKNLGQYIMIVDADDFVHRDLTSFVARNTGQNGWYIGRGYLWQQNSRWLLRSAHFSSLCGTSHIVRTDLYRIPASRQAAAPGYIQTMLGSHVMIEGILRDQGTPLAPLPFPGAVYRVGHSGAHSASRGILRSLLNPRRPARLAGLLQLRPKTRSIDRDFFAPPAPPQN